MYWGTAAHTDNRHEKCQDICGPMARITRSRRNEVGIGTMLRTRRYHVRIAADPSGRAVCGRLLAGITGSNPAGGIDVCVLCVLYSKVKKVKARTIRTKKYG